MKKALLIGAFAAVAIVGLDVAAPSAEAQPGIERRHGPRQNLYVVRYRRPGGRWTRYKTYQFAGQAAPAVAYLKKLGFEARYDVVPLD